MKSTTKIVWVRALKKQADNENKGGQRKNDQK